MPSRARVLIVAPGFKPQTGGVAEYAHQMAHAFHRRGVELLVIAPEYPDSADFDRGSELRIQRTRPRFTPTRHTPRLPLIPRLAKAAYIGRMAVEMCRVCRRAAPDILYLPSMYPFAALIPHSNIRIVTTFHGGELHIHLKHSRIAAVDRYVLRRSCRRADLILANSSYTKEALKGYGVDDGKIMVTGCGADWDRFKDVPDTRDAKRRLGLTGKKVILNLGTLGDRKGFDTVLKCLPELRKKFANVFYVMAGTGAMRPLLEKLVDQLDLRGCVRLTGRIEDVEVVDYMAACDVFAMPNRETRHGAVEGFGIVFLEVNCCRKPVIAGRSGGAIDAVEHEKTGLLVDPYSLEDVTAALERLLGDEALAAKLGRQGRERVERAYTWEAVAGRAVDRMLGLVT